MYVENPKNQLNEIIDFIKLQELALLKFLEIYKLIKKNNTISSIYSYSNNLTNDYYNPLVNNYSNQIKEEYNKKKLKDNNITDIKSYWKIFTITFLKEINKRIIKNKYYPEFTNDIDYINFKYSTDIINLRYVSLSDYDIFRKILRYNLYQDSFSPIPNEIEKETIKQILSGDSTENISIDLRNRNIETDFWFFFNEVYGNNKQLLEKIKPMREVLSNKPFRSIIDINKSSFKNNPYINQMIDLFFYNYSIPINLDIEKLLEGFLNESLYRLKNNKDNILDHIKDFILKEHKHIYIDLDNISHLYESINKHKDKIEVIKEILLILLKDLDNSNIIPSLENFYKIKKNINITTKDLKIEHIDLAYVCDNLLDLKFLKKQRFKKKQSINTLIKFNNISIKFQDITRNFLEFFIILGFKDFQRRIWKSYHEVEQIIVENNKLIFKDPKVQINTKNIKGIFCHLFLDKNKEDEPKIYYSDTFKMFMDSLKKRENEYYIEIYNDTKAKIKINFKDYTLWYVYFYKIYNILQKEERFLRINRKVEIESLNGRYFMSFFYLKIGYIITVNIFFDFLNYLNSIEYFKNGQVYISKISKENSYDNNIEKLGIFLENGLIKKETFKKIVITINELYNYQLSDQRHSL